MKFLFRSFEAKRKEIVEVEIDQPTKVKFMTARDLKAYRMGKTYSYHGGLFEESPVRFVIPYDGQWTAVVEKGTFRAPLEVAAHCRVLSPNGLVRSSIAIDAPPEIRQFAIDRESIEDAEQHASEISLASRSEG
ncbi:MAG: DUF1883 domain-containing protein [Flavobacteriales bacterium]|nr:DUF1883 domain-containing protein [Flavobacteriales bacterium]HPF89816.1 DUF1883 domain-containing protein [Flavobacteriales bacterium]